MFTAVQIREWFKELNQKHFNGLITYPLEINNRLIKGRLGMFLYKGLIRLYIKNPRFNDSINGENRIKETLLHEMVHAYLFKKSGNPKACGHNRLFKAHLKSILSKEFPHVQFANRITVNQNVDLRVKEITIKPYVPALDRPGITKEVPVTNIITDTPKLYKVKSTGKIGAVVGESNTVYGKRISLRIIGMLFPFTTSPDNLELV